MVLCCAKYTYPKALFADRTAIRGGKAGSPALLSRLLGADCQSAIGLHDYSAVAVSAMSCCDYPPYTRLVQVLQASTGAHPVGGVGKTIRH